MRLPVQHQGSMGYGAASLRPLVRAPSPCVQCPTLSSVLSGVQPAQRPARLRLFAPATSAGACIRAAPSRAAANGQWSTPAKEREAR